MNKETNTTLTADQFLKEQDIYYDINSPWVYHTLNKEIRTLDLPKLLTDFGKKVKSETVTCECCEKESSLEASTIDDDGIWTCYGCLLKVAEDRIDELQLLGTVSINEQKKYIAENAELSRNCLTFTNIQVEHQKEILGLKQDNKLLYESATKEREVKEILHKDCVKMQIEMDNLKAQLTESNNIIQSLVNTLTDLRADGYWLRVSEADKKKIEDHLLK